MSKKKIISLCLVVCLLATAIGGTLAYFTDTDDEVNVFTLGNVQIDLVEQQRNAAGTALEDFKDNNEPLVPMAKPMSAVYVGGHYLPNAENFVDKIVTVDNDGNVDAYVRVLLAVPKEMNDERGEVMLHLLSDGEESVDSTTEKWSREAAPSAVITLDGLEYSVYSFTYGSALADGATTKYPVITGVYLDKNVDATVNETTGAITYTMGDRSVTFNADEGLKLYVLAQGVQADGFEEQGADVALNEGFGEVNTSNAQDWFNAVN